MLTLLHEVGGMGMKRCLVNGQEAGRDGRIMWKVDSYQLGLDIPRT